MDSFNVVLICNMVVVPICNMVVVPITPVRAMSAVTNLGFWN